MTEREGEKLSSMKNEKNDVQRKFVLSWKKNTKKKTKHQMLYERLDT